MVDVVAPGARSGDLQGICETCGGPMHRHARRGTIAAMPGLDVHMMEDPGRLGGGIEGWSIPKRR